MLIVANNKSLIFCRGFVGMFFLVIFLVVSSLLFTGMKITDASMARQADLRAQEDLAGLKASIQFILKNQDLCPDAFRLEESTSYYRIPLSPSLPLNNKNQTFPKLPISLGSIYLKGEEILRKGTRYRSFLVDEIKLEDEDVDKSIRQDFLEIRADVLKLTVSLSRKSISGRTQRAKMEFLFNNFFRTDQIPTLEQLGDLHCWSTAVVGFDSCVTRAGDSPATPTETGIALAVCKLDETLRSGGGYCMHAFDYYLNERLTQDSVVPNNTSELRGYLVSSRVNGVSNTWKAICQMPLDIAKPARAFAICCRNDPLTITNE